MGVVTTNTGHSSGHSRAPEDQPGRRPRSSLTPRAALFLAIAVFAEVSASLSLKAALTNPWWYGVVPLGYGGAFALMVLVLRTGAPLGLTYGIWGASGVGLTAVLSAALFGEPFNVVVAAGVVLIAAGVLCVELGSRSHSGDEAEVQG